MMHRVDCGCYEWITAEVSTNTSPFGYGQDASRIPNTGLLGLIDSARHPIETVTFKTDRCVGMSPTAIAPSQSIDQLDGKMFKSDVHYAVKRRILAAYIIVKTDRSSH